MNKKLVVNVCEHETRVALLEDETIAELFIERQNETEIAGNIYKGRVQRVLPGMQAAFVDIGLSQAAFIYVDDVIGDQGAADFPMTDEEDAEKGGENDAGNAPPVRSHEIHIEEMLTEGQEIMVQVAKSPIGTKGPRVTSYISLPGRFLVLMPASDHVGISRRIEEEEERERLRQMVTDLRTGKAGYIVRTAAEGVQPEKLAYEMGFLKNLWNTIRVRSRKNSAPTLLHQELTVSLRAVRDLLTHEAEQLVVDSRATYKAILSFLDTFMPSLKESVELYEGGEPLFDAYNLEGDISRALKKKVWLKSGGYVVIEHTEALVAIDVNTGRYVGKHNLEETILKTNLEAVKEIAYQIRLRDIGGIIIIDFIDMEKKSSRDKVFNALREALRRDRSKTHVLPMSDMGLIQMTRKRVKKALTRMLCEPCFYCDGEGYLMSGQSVCYNIFREALRDARDMVGNRLTIRVNPDIAELLHGEENHIIVSLEQAIGRQIVVYPNAEFHFEEFDIFETVKC
ncbi:ribonuclease E/G [Desulfonema ishimotonii]|uniref:Ribonuclease G n=2 Tax=Desulfonema ishimotonii TaxID=45657 RepID=A0A401G3W5_9BACT|nr:Rne/Rng family ribonuclease [Desulfonema ishimotonii]GBC63805.1 ribonuclease E/G [Desulfonema ishimotonii]